MKTTRVAWIFVVLFVVSTGFNVYQYFSGTKKKYETTTAASVAVNPQEHYLCDMAKDHLKEHWRDRKEQIAKAMSVVNEPDEMKRKLEVDIAEISQTLKLSPEETAKFSTVYADVYRKHVDTFRIHFNSNPPQWKSMFEALKAFYSEQDRLVGGTFGEEKLNAFRESQITKRTPILAIVSNYADLPWDKTIYW